MHVKAWLRQVRGLLKQVVGTHNSYHLPPPDAIQDLAWNPDVAALAADYAQSAVNTSQYSHLDLYQQLELGKNSALLKGNNSLNSCSHLAHELYEQMINLSVYSYEWSVDNPAHVQTCFADVMCITAGVRSLEIDIFPDPVGKTYDQSVVLRVAGVSGWINNSALADPGFKVSSGQRCYAPPYLHGQLHNHCIVKD